MRYLNVWKKALGMAISEELAYKGNFIIKCLALIIVDFMGPIIAMLIYTTSAGIPGWSFEEFILFTGTVTLVIGLGHAFTFHMAWHTMREVRRGEFDKTFIKPMRPLVYLTLTSWDLEGFAEVGAGLVMIGWALLGIWADVTFGNLMLYLVLVMAGFLIQYSMMILISAIAFIAVQSWSLFDLFFNISKFARYPLNIFGGGIRIFFTFLFPLAVAAHYPTTALLHGMSLWLFVQVTVPVIGFFGFCLLMWAWAMRKYSSAGG